MQKSGTLRIPSPKPKIFEGLGSVELREILDAGEIRTARARQTILVAGDPATHLYLLLSGNAQFYRLSQEGERVPLMRLIKGDVFGLGTLLSNRMHYIGTAEAKNDSELLVWEHARIRKLAEKYPRLAENALGIVLRYLSAHTDRLVDLMTLNAAQRLARVLFHLGEKTGDIRPSGVEIEGTNEEFADLANVSTFTASRLFNKWARQGIVAKSRGKVFVYSPEKLIDSN
jgi:CRP-like cAMP-binding protein